MPVPSQCPLCGEGPASQHAVTRHVYGARSPGSAFFRCGACEVHYQYPGLTEEQEFHFYVAEFEGFMAGRSGASGGWDGCASHIRANEPTRLRRMRYLDPFIHSGARILEVGCSSGFMLLPLAARGHSCVGVEPSGVFGSHVAKQGIEVYTSIAELEAARIPRFDLIMHFFVLEHVRQPVEFLRSLTKLLRPGGAIVFEVPNAADPLHTLYDVPAFERFYWSVAHPWYFNERSLGRVLDAVSPTHEIRREQRYDLSNHLVWARDGKPGGMGKFSQVFGEVFDDAYRSMLVQSGLCDTLVGIVQSGVHQ